MKLKATESHAGKMTAGKVYAGQVCFHSKIHQPVFVFFADDGAWWTHGVYAFVPLDGGE